MFPRGHEDYRLNRVLKDPRRKHVVSYKKNLLDD